ncbi:MAG: FAD:protein FMN transferase [Candidatus Sphingomonas colombiensis]|nr:FAD:protein FMN transferase [Sphingomonas sp.]WEK42588.1 MAG: FAD:protein FMN transferase [Sphingomonas sp.]
MGTRWRVLAAKPHAADPAAIESAIITRLAGLVAEMSHWDEGSLLSRFNRGSAGEWIALPPDFATVVARALALAELTGGAFDPAIGRLVDLWGFGPPGQQPTPNEAAITAARAQSGWRRLAWDAPARRLRQPGGIALDLSGIAKGHAVDAVADLLGAHGVRHALIEVGGELVGRGIRPDGEPWWVDLENPPDASLAPLRIALHGLAVATSGRYVRGDHNIDPHTGRPPANDVIAASVIATAAIDADAWASALAVLGGEAGIALADRHGIAARLVCDNGAQIEERLSATLRAMLVD